VQGTRRAGGSGATDASYRSHPLRLAHAGRDGIGAYWSEVTADQRDPRSASATRSSTAPPPPSSGGPLLEEGQPSALIGTSRLAFTPDGLVVTGRDYWFLEPGAPPAVRRLGH
jgi:hypothetical protein